MIKALIAHYLPERRSRPIDEEKPLMLNRYGDLLIQQTLHSKLELWRTGALFSSTQVTATAPVIVPVHTGTPTSFITIYNGYPESSGRMLVIDRVSLALMAGGTGPVAIWWTLSKPGFTNPGSGALTPQPLNPLADQASQVLGVAGGTVVMAETIGWRPRASSPYSGAAVAGPIVEARFEGEVVVVPKAAFHIVAVSNATSNTVTGEVTWAELRQDMIGQ